MGVQLILGASVLLQCLAALLALRLIPVTGKKIAWSLIAAAILLMAIRRAITLGRLLSGDESIRPDPSAELVALAISLILVIGIAYIAPLFRSIRSSENNYRALAQQQGAIAQLSHHALSGVDPQSVMEHMVQTVRESIGVTHCALLECVSDNHLRLRASAGWEQGVVGRTMTRNPGSPEDFALKTTNPVIVQHFRHDHYFAPPCFLPVGECVSSAMIVVPGDDAPYGLLAVHTTTLRRFGPHDTNFLRAVASVLAAALQRKRAEHALHRVNDQLEQRVAERTARIRSANIQLRAEVNERRRAEAALVEAKEHAETANRAKSTFLSRMSHELRTPLNAILGFSELLLLEKEAPFTDLHRDNLTEIHRAGQHLLNLINEVLDLARVEAGKIEIRREIVDLKQIVEDCVALMQPMAQAKGICVTCDDPTEGGLHVRGDPVRLKEVFLNLLSNALKYNRDGGAVRVSCENRPEQRLRLSVCDTGPGIDPRELEELFEPFNRLGAESTPVEGTGIGLTITKRLVEMMGGELGVDSTPGEGSKFWVEFELLPADAAATLN